MQQATQLPSVADTLQLAGGVIPVVTFNETALAHPTADTLAQSGYSVLEITLRTEPALASIDMLRSARQDLVIGAGTVLNATQAADAASVGAQFLVSPGFSREVHHYSIEHDLPYLPGVATVTEAMVAADLGYRYMKLFPAETLGGVKLLKALGQVLPDLKFCPTGGINATNISNYQSLDNVVCVGGSWMVPVTL